MGKEKKKLFKNYNSFKKNLVNIIPLKKNIINELESNQKEKKISTDLITFSEQQYINSEIYDKILNLDSQGKIQKSKKSSNFSKNGYIDDFLYEYKNNYENILRKKTDKNKKNGKKGKNEETEETEGEDGEGEEEEEEEEEGEREGEGEGEGKYGEEEKEGIYENEIEERYYHKKLENKQYDKQYVDEYNEKEKYKDAYECEKEEINVDKKSEIKKEESINYNYWKDIVSKNNIILNKSRNDIKNISEESIIKDILLDIYKNTVEHKKTNFLCLEEILKKINLILKKQIEMNNASISHKSERQLLFQNIYELKKQIADKAFSSLSNKDFTKCCIKNICEENMRNKIDKAVKGDILNFKKLEKINKKNDKYFKDAYENSKTKNENINLFLYHLNELEKSIYTFTHFCRNISSLTYPDGRIGLNSLEQKVCLFLHDPKAMRLIRSLEKNLTKIKSICTNI
ncbi:conserved Plasmodium protein, unknown function [Plasmodium relictum]|uniref:Uncharacterized protein n=1 Tax=Plasmodium relictum TaxID=85471 RepID=A0A1J1H137_PLARL|nr:conserved Plasmodium protein, unknown function [Plasmodium relictum]CRG98501.1 conserved Plasmodium protein, unknown function [Plasmodium relictum]